MDDHTHTLSELREISEAKDVFESDLDEFIERVSGSNDQPGNPYYLHTLACHIDFEHDQRTTHFFEVLVRMVLDGYPRPPSDPLEHAVRGRSFPKACEWEAPFRAMVHMMLDMDEDGYRGPQDHAIVEVVDREWTKILTFLSKDLSVFIRNDQTANDRRHNVIAFLRLIATLHGTGSVIRKNQSDLDLLLTCWANVTPPLRAEARTLIATIFDPEHRTPAKNVAHTMRWEITHGAHKGQRRVGSKNIPMLLKSFRRWLNEPNVIDMSLEWELGCIATLLDYDGELCDAFFAAQCDEDVLAALKRQKIDGAAASLQNVTLIVYRCLNMMSPRVFSSAVIRQISAGSLEIAFSCICRDVADNKSKDEVFKSWWAAYISLLFRVLLQDPEEPREWTQQIEDDLRSQVETIFIPMQTTILRLRDAHNTETLSLLEHMWKSLCARLDVSEAVAWRRASVSTSCSNPLCVVKNDHGPTLRNCKDCRVARYCSGQCQNSLAMPSMTLRTCTH